MECNNLKGNLILDPSVLDKKGELVKTFFLIFNFTTDAPC